MNVFVFFNNIGTTTGTLTKNGNGVLTLSGGATIDPTTCSDYLRNMSTATGATAPKAIASLIGAGIAKKNPVDPFNTPTA